MKRTIGLALIFVALGVAGCKGGCQKGEEPAAPTPEETAQATISADLIADALSKAVCTRMVACNQSAGVNETDCAAGMTKDLAQALPEQAKAVNKGTLDLCTAAITKATCEELNSPNPPKGCEFMN